ncbi:phosphotransferase [Kitasatospora sp. NPDC093806]|uniref:phosphotransferase n=1 Tax=Kitasatospora sp. NPDC093806 TaxID=3155075 RepID=UPI0034403E19
MTERVSVEAGVPVMVVRLVSVTGGEGGHGGHTVYHVEALERPTALLPREAGPEVAALLGPAERRADWATPDGLRAAVEWAERALAAAGRPLGGPVEQVRTWNLSGLFRLPTAAGPTWLKVINPAFNSREGEAIALFGAVDPALVPPVLAADAGRGLLLLDEVPGEDCWGPSAEEVAGVVPRLVAVQATLAADGRAAAAGLRDRTPRAVAAAVGGLLDRLAAESAASVDADAAADADPGKDAAAGTTPAAGSGLTAEELAAARALVERLPALVEELAACGLPETVVHGDFHPGNWRSDGTPPVVVDYADTCLGHPAMDGLRPRAFVDAERWTQLAGEWARAWRAHVPGCAPERALELAEPLFHLGYALRYQEFLDHIEDSERPYHEGDPASEIRRALEVAG